MADDGWQMAETQLLIPIKDNSLLGLDILFSFLETSF